MKQKTIYAIIDGLGDLPVAELGGRTPLEAAATPVLNRMATLGRIGLVDVLGPGIVPNTHSGTGSIMGVLPEQLSRLRRGPVEAAGAGFVLRRGEIAFRANFATLDNTESELKIRDRRAGRIVEGTRELARSLDGLDLGDGITAHLQPTDQHRVMLVLKGPGLHDAVSDTDPGDRSAVMAVRTCQPLEPDAERTAEKVNRFVSEAHARLQEHPLNRQREAEGALAANGIITRGAGAAFELDSLLERRGMKASVVAACNTVLGLARILGYEGITDPRFTADANTDLDAKVVAALEALQKNDLAFVHIKAPDLFSHDLQPAGKRDFLERLDASLARIETAGVRFALSADHTTDSNSGSHTADPVPSLIFDPAGDRIESVDVINFGEKACSDGNMPRQTSHEFILHLLS